jgi:1,2-diacylglycerol 3-beta-galactosyltransferase
MRFLISYYSIGLGHLRPAVAIGKDLAYAGQSVSFLDFNRDLPKSRVAQEMDLFWRACLNHPSFYSAIYSLTDFPGLCNLVRERHARMLVEEFSGKFPSADVFVSTHFTSAAAMVRAGLPVTLVVTEVLAIHAYWVVPGVKEYIVPSKQIRKQLRDHGVRCPIKVFRYPHLRPLPSMTRGQIRRMLGIPDRMLCILISGGGEGISGGEKIIEGLAKAGLELAVIFVCGKNSSLHSRLEKRKFGKLRFILKGFVDNMADLILASDIAAGKAGPNSILESLHLMKPYCCITVLRNELAFSEYIVRKKFGWRTRSVREFVRLASALSADRRPIRRIAKRLRRIRFSSGAKKISRYLIRKAV